MVPAPAGATRDKAAAMHIIIEYLPVLLKGLLTTLALAACGILVAVVVAFAVALARLSRYVLVRVVATVYLEIFRGTSALVQLFWIFFVLPFLGVALSPFVAGVLAIGLNTASYGSEVVRSAILSVPRGQTEAATALNYTAFPRMFHIILPQALPVMLPTMGNLSIELLKLTSVVSLITISDLTFAAQLIRSATGSTFAPYVAILVVYFVISSIIVQVVTFLERKLSVGRSNISSARSG